MPIQHISATQVAMFARCPAGWMYSYIRGIKGRPSSAMTRGTCVHKGIAHNYRAKVQSHEDLPVSDVLDHYDTTFTELSEETEWKSGEDPGKQKDAGYRVLKLYQEKAAPGTQPVDVEQNFRMMINWTENPGQDDEEAKSVEFRGILDLLDADNKLRDYKTTAQTRKAPGGDDEVQLIGYAIGKEAMDGKMPSAWVDYLVTTKTPKIVSFPVVVGDSQKKFFLSHIPRIVKAMESENYYPARGNRWCSKGGCFYHSMCMEEFGG